jgi:hypothetical protein
MTSNGEATPMRFIVPLLLALILITPAAALTLQDLLVPGAELDAGRLSFTDFHLNSITGIGAEDVPVRGLATGGLAFPDVFESFRARPEVELEITFVASAPAGINGFTFAADEVSAIPGNASASLTTIVAGVGVGLPECFFPFFCPNPAFDVDAFRQIPTAASVPVDFRLQLIAGPENDICGGCIGDARVTNPNITFAVPEPGSALIGGAGIALLLLVFPRFRNSSE